MSGSSEGSYVELALSEVFDFIVGSELALLYADVTGGRPNRFVVLSLRRQRPDLRIGAVPAFSLADAPARLRELLAPQLGRLGLSELWVPTGYYLFHDSTLIGHRNTRPPATFKGYQPLLVVAGIAVVERLVTRRWGWMAKMVPLTAEITLGFSVVDELSVLLREAAKRARGPSSSRASGGVGGREAGQEATGRSGSIWSNDPYAVLGVSRSTPDEAIKQAFRRLTIEHHPDKARSEPDRVDREARQKQINLAYEAIRKDRGR